jgi:hypothetical protein
MQKVEEEVILRILAQESLNLELWLEIYEELKFRGLFWEIFLARDFSRNIFSKIRGLTAKILGHGLITQKSRDPFARFLENLE